MEFLETGPPSVNEHPDQAAEPSFEQAFRALQETITLLEDGGLTLEQSIQTFERGIELANMCSAMLDRAELRVTQIVESQSATDDEPDL